MSNLLILLFIATNFFQQKIPVGNITQTLRAGQTAPLFDLGQFKPKKTPVIQPEILGVHAKYLLVKELGGSVIYQKNASDARPIASITKLMTTAVAYGLYPQEKEFTIPKEISSIEGESGSFRIGEQVSRNDLMKAALLSSSNDAAYTLSVESGKDVFIARMNDLATSIGMSASHFEDATGLSSQNKSSLKDLAALSEYIFRNYPQVFEWSRQESTTIGQLRKRTLTNINYLLPSYKQYIIGSKTGFTDDAGECLALVVKFKNSPYLFIGLLDSTDRFADAEKIILALREFYEKDK